MDPYKVLGISTNASPKEVHDAYKNILENFSIDTSEDGVSKTIYDEKLSELNEAYRLISNNLAFEEVRELIESDDFLAAEAKLNLISDTSSPEWNYLTGVLLLKKGWVHSGVNHLKKAATLNPYNTEYQNTIAALNQKINSLRANYNNTNQGNSGGGLNLCGGNASQNKKGGLC